MIFFECVTGNLITILCLLKHETFSTCVHHASHIIENAKGIFETSHLGLVDSLCHINTEGKIMSDRNTQDCFRGKISFDPEHLLKFPVMVV